MSDTPFEVPVRESLLRQVGVHGDETLAEWVHAKTEGFQRLRAQQFGRLVRSQKGKDSALSALEPNLDLGHVPDCRLPGRKDYTLSVNRPIPKGSKQASWQGQVRGSGIHKDRLSLRRPAVCWNYLDLHLKKSHDQALF